jgi:hypothetical protein
MRARNHEVEVLGPIRCVVMHPMIETEDNLAVLHVTTQQCGVHQQVEQDTPAGRQRVSGTLEWYCHATGFLVRVSTGTVSV